MEEVGASLFSTWILYDEYAMTQEAKEAGSNAEAGDSKDDSMPDIADTHNDHDTQDNDDTQKTNGTSVRILK